MSETPKSVTPRREFLKNTARLAAVSALAGVTIPHVHAAEDNTIRLALIGCGGRGSGAVANALSAGGLVMDNRFRAQDEKNADSCGPVKLTAMADLFADRLGPAHNALTKAFGDKIDVPKERQFLGFDAYRKAIDCLRPGDVAILTTHAGFRPTHLEYAVEKGVNVFMEKCFASDPGGTQQVLRAGEAAEKKNLKIGAGLMCRHSSARQALIQKIRDGAMGQVQLDSRLSHGSRLAHGTLQGQPERTPLPDSQRLPVLMDQPGPVHRTDDPPDRRVLLDQGRLAGGRPRRGRAGRP